jgi:2-haloacid dehalogenase
VTDATGRLASAVVFDVGNVLIRWDPKHLYRKVFTVADGTPDEARIDWFLDNVCDMAWNVAQDLGRPIAEANALLVERHPELQAEIQAYYGRFQEMIPGPIAESVAALERLKAAGVPVYGLTNFGRETFPPTRERFPFLASFDGVVVSGEERVIKPDPAIFRLLTARFGIEPSRTLFVDDSPRNIAAAEALGFHVHLFDEPAALAGTLERLGLG